MPLVDVEGLPSLKFFRSTSCLSMSAICACSLSSCLRTEATYCASTGWESSGLGLFFASPTTETVPLAPEMFSRSEEHTSELQSLRHLVCRLLLEKKKPA